jgi:hypothetical protein
LDFGLVWSREAKVLRLFLRKIMNWEGLAKFQHRSLDLEAYLIGDIIVIQGRQFFNGPKGWAFRPKLPGLRGIPIKKELVEKLARKYTACLLCNVNYESQV